MSELLQIFIDTLKGKNFDYRPLFSFWRQFPRFQSSSEALAEAHIEFYNRFHFDLLRITPPENYLAVDFGCKLSKEFDNQTGFRKCVNFPIKTLEDWEEIEQPSPGEGYLGNLLKVIKIITKKLETVPKAIPIITPLKLASILDPKIGIHTKQNSDLILESLQELYSLIEEFTLSAIDMGANGIMVETISPSNLEHTSESLFLSFETRFLSKILARIKKYSDFTILRIDDNSKLFKRFVTGFSPDGVSWDSSKKQLSIEIISNIFNKGLITGLDSNALIEKQDETSLKEYIYGLLKTSQDLNNRLVIAPNDTLFITIPQWKLEVISNSIYQRYKRVKNE